jgi:hypothetical protein
MSVAGMDSLLLAQVVQVDTPLTHNFNNAFQTVQLVLTMITNTSPASHVRLVVLPALKVFLTYP